MKKSCNTCKHSSSNNIDKTLCWQRDPKLKECADSGNCSMWEPIPTDEIENPAHYTSGEIACIDAIRAALTEEEFRGYCKGNILKYIWREKHKSGEKDIQKAGRYIKFMEEKK